MNGYDILGFFADGSGSNSGQRWPTVRPGARNVLKKPTASFPPEPESLWNWTWMGNLTRRNFPHLLPDVPILPCLHQGKIGLRTKTPIGASP